MTRWSMDEYLGRNDNVALPSAKRMRSEQGERKYNAMLEARRQGGSSAHRLSLTASLAVLVVLIGVIGVGVQSNRAKIGRHDSIDHGERRQNGVVFGKTAKATVDLYEDFQCPLCLEFEQSGRADARSLMSRPSKAQAALPHALVPGLFVEREPVLDSRAANAAICASDVDVATLPEVPRRSCTARTARVRTDAAGRGHQRPH